METSDKHSPRLSDDLTKDTRAGHQELRELAPDVALTDNDAEARSELARHLEPSAFPARTEQLIDVAKENFATDAVIDLLETLPDRVYDNVQEVWETLGGEVEPRRS
jgi:hypothetical protein